MRALSLTQAKRCESSQHGRCRCRCGGALHGAQRGLDEDFFHTLPESDPHRATVRAEKQPRPRKRRDTGQGYLFEIFGAEGK
jgi:hypothetical protein